MGRITGAGIGKAWNVVAPEPPPTDFPSANREFAAPAPTPQAVQPMPASSAATPLPAQPTSTPAPPAPTPGYTVSAVPAELAPRQAPNTVSVPPLTASAPPEPPPIDALPSQATPVQHVVLSCATPCTAPQHDALRRGPSCLRARRCLRASERPRRKRRTWHWLFGSPSSPLPLRRRARCELAVVLKCHVACLPT
jgi:hypothetical protein